LSQLSYTNLVDGDQPQASGFNSRFLLAINLLNAGIGSDNIAALAVNGSHLNLGAYIFKESKGADVASATTTTLGNDGNFFDITGTTTITSIASKAAGTVVRLQFDGILTLTDGSNLKLAGNFVTAAESTITLVSDGSNWYELSRSPNTYTPTASNALAGSVVQTVNTQTGAVSTTSTAIPNDDTIPQNTEGGEFMTLAITPTSATNKLKITVVANLSNGSSVIMVGALFQDSTANAIAASRTFCPSNNVQVVFTHYMTSGTTSSTTFKLRCGADSGTTTFNGSGGTRQFGGVMASSITIEEIKV
jgi:hypothetical protein